ncbi:MAG: glycine--tRNA ligase, partial [Dehalococcoidia bacterium]
MPAPDLDTIVSLAKRRGFVFPSAEIYGGFANTYDWGPLGTELKRNIRELWWRAMVRNRDDVVGLDAALLTNPRVWVASGHVDSFSDPLVDCRTCKLRFRADHLEEQFSGDHSDAGEYAEIKRADDGTYSCPRGRCDFTDPREFNMMFRTQVGAVADEGGTAYLPPETAQGIFVNFENVLASTRRKLPFGVAQTRVSFRNEITPGRWIFRTLEFEQIAFLAPAVEQVAPPGVGGHLGIPGSRGLAILLGHHSPPQAQRDVARNVTSKRNFCADLAILLRVPPRRP